MAGGLGTNTDSSNGLDGIEVELQDFKDAKYPALSSVAQGEQDNVVMFGKIGQKPIERKLNVQGEKGEDKAWSRTTSDSGLA